VKTKSLFPLLGQAFFLFTFFELAPDFREGDTFLKCKQQAKAATRRNSEKVSLQMLWI